MYEITKILIKEDVIETSMEFGLKNRLLLDQALYFFRQRL